MNYFFQKSIFSKISMGIISLVIFLLLFINLHAQQSVSEVSALDSKTQAAIIDSVTKAMNEVYVFPDVAQNMEKLVRQNFKEGKYKAITTLAEFTERLTSDLQSVSKDKHLRIRPMPPRDPNAPTRPSPEEQQKQRLAQLRKDNFGFKKVELLPGNIGYIDFRYFADAGFGEAGATAIAAMNFLAHADAIIFDMRQNGGGHPSMIQLISSYLFEEPVHLNSFYIRKTNKTQQFWTQGHVQGPKMIDVPVFVLTSSFTFSGAEEFTYNLKNLKRGMIIGETTGGGAHPVEGHVFENLNVAMSLPFGRAVNPITQTNWEGTGIEPDIKVPADQALMVARIEATKALMEKAKDEATKKQLAWVLQGLEVEKNPVKLDEKIMGTYVGIFGPRKIWLESGTLYYQREGRPQYKMIPMGEDTFAVQGLDYFRIKFNRDESGNVIELVGMYDNGTTDSSMRNKK